MKFNRVLRTLGLLALLLVVEISHAQLLLFGAKEKGKKYGFINERGDYVIAAAFDEVGFFSKGAAIVKQGKKFGIINEQGQFTVQPIYDGATLYAPEAKFTVKKGTKWGVVNSNGEEIIPFQYDYLSVMKDGYIVGGSLIPGKAFKNRVCPIVLNDKNEVVFETGQNDPEGHDCSQLFLPGFAYPTTGNYSPGFPMVRDGMLIVLEAWEGGPNYAQYKVMDVKTGLGIVLQQEMSIADDYLGMREGTLAIDLAIEEENQDDEDQIYGRVKVIPENANRKGVFYDTANIKTQNFDVPLFSNDNLAVANQFQRAHPFFNGVAAVQIDNKWAFVDREGWIINETKLATSEYKAFPPMYFNGLIGLFKNGKAGYVDINGKEVIPFTLDEYHPFEYAVTPVKKGGLYGLLRKDGSWAVAPKFEKLSLSPCPCYQ